MRRWAAIGSALAVVSVIIAVVWWTQRPVRRVVAEPLPEGDVEIAWIHTSTNSATWERFVKGVRQASRRHPDWEVDDRRAFLDRTAAVPEIVIGRRGSSTRVRIRWYKLSGEVGTRQWVEALADRDPPPIAFVGGGTSDRAAELATALRDRTEWQGERPLLLVTTATADRVTFFDRDWKEERLTSVYQGRTFRFCYSNSAMARAVVEFVWQQPSLRPIEGRETKAYIIKWEDDPYSEDLADQFEQRFRDQKGVEPPLRLSRDSVGYSVGTYQEVNRQEASVATAILSDLASAPDDRAILVLPAVTQPARRIVRAFASDSPLIGRRMIALTGDGISFNNIYRDAEVQWPIRDLCVPLVSFCHQNPVAWNEERDDDTDRAHGSGKADRSDRLDPPHSTDDVLLFADLVDTAVSGILVTEGSAGFGADRLKDGLHRLDPPLFDPSGDRLPGRGAHIVLLKPHFLDPDRISSAATYEIYARQADGRWAVIRQLVREFGREAERE